MSDGFADTFRADFARLCEWRRDVRRFHAEPLPEGALRRLIETAGTAPSVGLSEPWRFAIVESPAMRARLTANFEAENARALAGYEGERQALYAGLKLAGLRDAPGLVAAFCDEGDGKGQGLGTRTMPEMRRYSVVCAIMQIWLAARAEGIGMGWVSIIDPAAATHEMGVPAGWKLIALLCLGYPAEEHTDPELERAGWEPRAGASGRIITI